MSEKFDLARCDENEFVPTNLPDNFTIGIAAHGNSIMTFKALQALFSSVSGEYELILVDDASPDDNLSVFMKAAEIHSRTTVFALDENREYTESVNTILSHSHGEYTLFLSNDILVNPYYFSELLQIAKTEPNCGVIRGCSNIVDNGLDTHNIKCLVEPDSLRSLFSFAECRQAVFGGELLDDIFLTGDAFLVSRMLLNDIGIFDNRFVGYFSDHDFGVRAKKAGYRTLLAKGAFAYHCCGTNFSYLEDGKRKLKEQSRFEKIQKDGNEFLIKYGLDTTKIYEGIASLPWAQIVSVPFNKISDYYHPVDYTQFIVR